jgi:hypothetical protein
MKMTSGKRALDKIYKRRNRYEIPDWQRGEVWDGAKKQELIDSILRGWKLPKCYFVKNAEDEYEVLAKLFPFAARQPLWRVARPSSARSTSLTAGFGRGFLMAHLYEDFFSSFALDLSAGLL